MGVSNGGEGGTIVNVSSMAGHAKLGNFPFNLAKEEIVQEFYLPKIKYYNRALVGLSMCTDNSHCQNYSITCIVLGSLCVLKGKGHN